MGVFLWPDAMDWVLAHRRKVWYTGAMKLPAQFCQNMQAMLGPQYADFLASYDHPPYKGLRVNPRYAEAMAPLVQKMQPIAYQQGGYYCDEGWGNHVLHAAGAYYLQDPSAMIVANSLSFGGDECVLDMCAAPGGKSTQLAAMVPRGTLVSNEIDLGRAKVLLGNIERMGFENVIVTCLPPEAVADRWAGQFDVVVVDAPCSGEGMFRKNPLAVEEWSPENVALCAARQRRILNSAVRCLRPGGRLVYSTCTFSAQENEQNVQYLTDTYPLHCVPVTPQVQAVTVEGLLPHTRRFYPHLGQGEGHFVAVLAHDNLRTADNAPYYTKDALPLADAKAVRGFLAELGCRPQGVLLTMGDNISLYRGALPVPHGALCAGVKLGTLQKGRLQPHHMLWRCLPVANRLFLAATDPRVAAYLHGDSLTLCSTDGPLAAGWGVLCVEGCALGGFKNVDGILKNHYPIGLRT